MREFAVNQGFVLSVSQRRALVQLHKAQPNKKLAYRVNAIIMLADGFTPADIERILLMSERHVRRCREIYLEQGVSGLLQTHFQGSDAKLDEDQLKELEKHIAENLYQTANEIRNYIFKHFRVRYTTKGLVPLLHRLGFVYKKAKGIPGKCDPEAQKRFVRKYWRLRKILGKNDRLYFADAAHPTFNTTLAYGWIKKGEEKCVKTNSGRHRLNLHGAYDPIHRQTICLLEDSVNSDSTIRLLDEIARVSKKKGRTIVIVDGASYYVSKLVRLHAKSLGIELVFLPAYSPNLNLIERLWKFFRKIVLANRYHETLEEFSKATILFFKNLHRKYQNQLATLMTETFHFFDPPEPAKSG
jgi:transposase